MIFKCVFNKLAETIAQYLVTKIFYVEYQVITFQGMHT